MAVLITGAGLIGRHVAAELAARGESVTLVDRRPPPIALPPGVRFAAGDIADMAFMQAQVAELGVCDIVNTAAVLAVTAREDPPLAVRTNLLAAVQLLDMARQGRIRRLVLASSSSINSAAYRSDDVVPIPEDFEARVLSQGPGSFYIASKLAMEHFCQLYRNSFGVSAVALRFGAVLGAAGWGDVSLVARLALRIVSAARAQQPLAIEDQRLLWEGKEEFLDPRDAAVAVAATLAAGDLPQTSYNITSPRAVSIDELFGQAREAFPGLITTLPVAPKGGFLNFPHPRTSPTDVSAAKRDLGFEAGRSAKDALIYLNEQLPLEVEATCRAASSSMRAPVAPTGWPQPIRPLSSEDG